jgi:hypothetical protein
MRIAADATRATPIGSTPGMRQKMADGFRASPRMTRNLVTVMT